MSSSPERRRVGLTSSASSRSLSAFVFSSVSLFMVETAWLFSTSRPPFSTVAVFKRSDEDGREPDIFYGDKENSLTSKFNMFV